MQKLSMSMLPTRLGTCIKFVFLATLLSTVYFLHSTAFVSAKEQWTIDSFDSVIQVNEDATLTVTETIDVTFNVDKHGIYRDIPVRYSDEYGNRHATDLRFLSFKQDGKPAHVSYTYNYSMTSIRIGDEDKTITGSHEYQITYTVDRVFLYFDDYDELYWNVTGTDWEVPISHASATVILPDGTEIVQSSCYTGEYGSEAQDCTKQVGGSTEDFTAEDFLTVAVGFSKGIIYEPTSLDRFIWLVEDNWLGIIPLLLLMGVFFLWLKHGKDIKIDRAIVAQYEPPKGMKAVYAGMILCNGNLKPDHMSAMIIQLAVDGYIKIDVQEKEKIAGIFKQTPTITLTPLKTSEGLDTAHAYYFDMLFKGRMDSVTLENIKRTVKPAEVQNLKRKINAVMFDSGYFIKKSSTYSIFVFILGASIAFFGFSVASVFGLFVILSCIICGVAICILGFLMKKLTQKGADTKWELLGFKDFMHTAERYRSAWQEKENIFADYLPYAIAFNDVQKWAKTFEGMHQVKPDWYSGNVALITMASAGRFNSVTNVVKSSTLPGSSGSGGGGHSGGGFGGGGGGSW
ncbi:MAG: DUF2207 domain-containing protein [Patescibacteria group bacterium]